jgi:ligand-binding sensor domain-containing protein/serine phosphatase RsbU (regulator of sigma subunit)
MLKSFFLFLSVFLFSLINIQAVDNELFFEKLTSKNGRTFGWITGISSCKNDFIWFSTRDGLYRYDGYNYKLFKKNSNDSSSFLFGDITFLYRDNSGKFWLRHFDKIGAFENEKVLKHFPQIADSTFLLTTKIIQDREGNYWIGPTQNGLIRYSKKMDAYTTFQCAPAPYATSFTDLFLDNSGRVCVVCPSGISRYNKDKKVFDFFNIDFNSIFKSAEFADYMVAASDKGDSYWIGTISGLVNYNISSNKYRLFQSNSKDTLLTGNTIICLFKDSYQNLWVGTDNGLNIISPAGIVQKIKATNKNGLYSNYIYSIYEDFSHNIWLATNEGLNKLKRNIFTHKNLNCKLDGDVVAVSEKAGEIWYPGNKNQLIHMNYYTDEKTIFKLNIPGYDSNSRVYEELIYNDIYNDRTHIWLALDNKLFGFNKEQKTTDKKIVVDAVVSGNDSIPNKIFTIEPDFDNKLWITCLTGIVCYNRETQQKIAFLPYFTTLPPLYNIDINYVQSTTRDLSGNIYIRTAENVLQLNIKTRKLKEIYNFAKDPDFSGLKGNVEKDIKGHIWFAMLPNFFKFDPKTDSTTKFSFSSKGEISNCFIVPNLFNIWIYSNNGLYRYNAITKEYKSYFYNDGLPSDIINGLRISKNSQVWLTTNKGLSNFNIDNNTFSNYFTSSDNLPLSFKAIPKRLDIASQELIFFTTNSYLFFNTDSINKHIPKVVLTGIDLFGNELITDSLIFQKKHLKLKYDQNRLDFHFAALDFTVPEKNMFAYKLEGVDKEWQYTSATDRTAKYTNLSPGKYKFKVKACNNDLVWNNEGTTLLITITPPWYKTIWAYIFYVIFGAFLLYSFIKFRERRLKEEKRLLEQKVTERTETIRKQNKEIIAQHDHIAEQKKNITDSIQYAKQIQTALLPPENLFDQYFSEFFVLYMPRDIVSGDFYWLTEKDNKIILAAADCTGHGVPGAFMSMLGVSALTEIVGKMTTILAADILDQLRAKIIFLLRQSTERVSSKDGMDIAMCVYDRETMELQYAGAFNSLYIVNNNEFGEIKADRMPIGISEKRDPFKNNVIKLQKGDVFYMFSDGYVDQFHYETNQKFKSKRFQEMLKTNSEKKMTEQKVVVENQIIEWIGTGEQIDDIMVVGIRI